MKCADCGINEVAEGYDICKSCEESFLSIENKTMEENKRLRKRVEELERENSELHDQVKQLKMALNKIKS